MRETEFAENLQHYLQEYMEEGYSVQVSHVVKNNGIELDGICIHKAEERCTPMIYVNDYIEQYENGSSIEEIGRMIWNRYEKARKAEGSFEELKELSLSSLKDKIIYRLVNYDKNEEALKKQPYIRFLDLAVTFQCLVRQGKRDIGTIRISNELMEYWDIGEKELYYEAKMNTPRLFPASIRTMDQVILDIMEKEMKDIYSQEEREEIMAGVKEQMTSEDMMRMYILSNQSGVNGASALLYEKELQEFANKKGEDFFVLPSSIHEVILVPYRESLTKESLMSMVQDINRTQVPTEDVLSDQVYLYRRTSGVVLWE